MADISDILASVSHPPSDPSTTELQSLTRAYIAERCAPDLLPYPTALLSRTLSRLRRQIAAVEDATARSADPSIGGGGGSGDGAQAGFRLVVLQTDLERWKWLIRGLLRARLAKIDAFPLHVLRDKAACLSEEERDYLSAHQALLERHYVGSFLGAFPEALRRLDDTAGGISMVDAPDLEKAVFVRALRDVGRMEIEGGEGEVYMRKGDVWVVRWRNVSELVEKGEVELV